MAEEHKHPNYMAIFVALIIMTVLEIAAAKLYAVEGLGMVALILLVGLALAKALLVALYFMHLKFETTTFVLIVSAPVIFAVILILGLLPDVAKMWS